MLCSDDTWEEVFDIIKKRSKKICIVPHALVKNTLPIESKIRFHNNTVHN